MTVARYEFEQWFRKYWAGIPLLWLDDADEYAEAAAQTAWECWRRHWPKQDPRDTKLWSVFKASRYREGRTIEEYDHGVLSSMPPMMVEYADYAAVHKVLEDKNNEIDRLIAEINRLKGIPNE